MSTSEISDADYGIAFLEDETRLPQLWTFSDDCRAFLSEHVPEKDLAVSIPSTICVELNLNRSWILGLLDGAAFENWMPD
jgi:hypothetical protein